jgi:hypothetical protein
MYRSLSLLLGGLILLSAAALPAQDATLAQMYGSGVHAYFSRDYQRAYEYLTLAIDGGTKDPRPYYFRGMACLHLGRPEDAQIDFRNGAEKESRDINKFYNVSKSLERIQGRPRLMLEQYRVKARMAARQEAERLHKARYDQIRQEEGRFLEQQIGQVPRAPSELPVEPSAETEAESPFEETTPSQPQAAPPSEPESQPPLAAPTVEPDPFARDTSAPPAVAPAAKAAAEPTTTEEPGVTEEPTTTEKPEGTEPPAAKKPGGMLGALGRSIGKALGTGKQPSAATPPGPATAQPKSEPPPDEATEDPFAEGPDNKKAAEDPFGKDNAGPAQKASPQNAPDKKATGEKDAGDQPDASSDDPFAG